MLRGIPAAALLGLAVWALLVSLVYLLGCTDPMPDDLPDPEACVYRIGDGEGGWVCLPKLEEKP